MRSRRLTECRLCGSANLSAILTFPDSPAGDLYKPQRDLAIELPRFPLGCNLCVDCGHVQLNYFVDPFMIYSEYIYITSDSVGLDKHFESYADDLLGYVHSTKPRTILEIGCNDGTLLEKLCRAGHTGIGLDPAEYPLSIAASKGLTVVHDYFSAETATQIEESYGKMDIIIANNVLANVENLNEVFSSFKSLISSDGVIVFETGYLEHVISKKVIDNIHHEHIDYFSVTPLIGFLKKFDLFIDRVIINESKGSSIRIFAKPGASTRTSSDVEAIASNEVAQGFFDVEKYSKLNLEIQEESIRIKNLIKKARSLGHQIVGYGAAIGSTTLILTLDLENEFDFLVDDNPRRVGQYAPGTGINVKSLADVNSAECTVVILAWRYEDSILPKLMNLKTVRSVTSIWSK
ncbi:AdoMet_MTases domain containing protein [Candidatus Nanopelagicaceae bacterium]